MHFDDDIFLSYAHIDDQALAEGQKGWISTLHRALEVRLGQLLGKEPRIWRDAKLNGNDIFADGLLERLPHVGVLLSILSPRYVKSEWCQRELQAFLQVCQSAPVARLSSKSRVFKVVKTPVPLDAHPTALKPVLGYEFYIVDTHSGRARELRAPSSPDVERLYWDKLDDLAHDIADLLCALDGPGSGWCDVSSQRETVFLAETSYDLRQKRDAIKRELQEHGFKVVPEQPLPLIADELIATVREQLAASRLSVHIVGRSYGVVPDGSTISSVVLQHQLAVERAAAGGDFCRLVWVPPDVVPDDAREQQFIESLETDSGPASGMADVLTTSLEEFKTVLHVRLTPPRREEAKTAPPAAVTEGTAHTTVYLICDQRDVDATRELQDVLFERGLEVIVQVFDGDESNIRRDYEENLRDCDVPLVYYGQGGELWLRSKLREMQKAAGYGRTQPFRAKAVYVADPDTPEKQRFRTLEALVLRRGQGSMLDAVTPLLTHLR
jgi:hypothetical protein